jgi:hypothetical protein
MSACPKCLRRSWLLGALAKQLRYRGRDPERLLDLLALADEELIQAVGADESDSLRERHTRFDPAQLPTAPNVEAICRHDPRYPPALATPAGAAMGGAPQMLHVAGGIAPPARGCWPSPSWRSSAPAAPRALRHGGRPRPGARPRPPRASPSSAPGRGHPRRRPRQRPGAEGPT